MFSAKAKNIAGWVLFALVIMGLFWLAWAEDNAPWWLQYVLGVMMISTMIVHHVQDWRKERKPLICPHCGGEVKR